MDNHTGKSGYTRQIEAPAEISILDTYREVCQEVHPMRGGAGRLQRVPPGLSVQRLQGNPQRNEPLAVRRLGQTGGSILEAGREMR